MLSSSFPQLASLMHVSGFCFYISRLPSYFGTIDSIKTIASLSREFSCLQCMQGIRGCNSLEQVHFARHVRSFALPAIKPALNLINQAHISPFSQYRMNGSLLSFFLLGKVACVSYIKRKFQYGELFLTIHQLYGLWSERVMQLSNICP